MKIKFIVVLLVVGVLMVLVIFFIFVVQVVVLIIFVVLSNIVDVYKLFEGVNGCIMLFNDDLKVVKVFLFFMEVIDIIVDFLKQVKQFKV